MHKILICLISDIILALASTAWLKHLLMDMNTEWPEWHGIYLDFQSIQNDEWTMEMCVNRRDKMIQIESNAKFNYTNGPIYQWTTET